MNYLSDYQTFHNTQELNHHVKQHEQAHATELNATDRSILRFIARYSVKYSGSSHLKVATIAEAVEKSERTIGRILKRLESLGIIRRVGTIRPKSGGRGASIIQILPFDEAVMSERMSERENSDKATEATDKPVLFGYEPLRKQYNSSYVLDTALEDAGLRNNVPAVLYDVLSPFYAGKELRKYISIVFRAKSSKVRIEAHEDDFKTVILDVIRRYKRGMITNIDGYLYAAIRKLSRGLFIGIVAAK